VLLFPAVWSMGGHIGLTGPFAPAAGGVQPVASEVLYSFGRQVLGEKGDKIGRAEEL